MKKYIEPEILVDEDKRARIRKKMKHLAQKVIEFEHKYPGVMMECVNQYFQDIKEGGNCNDNR